MQNATKKVRVNASPSVYIVFSFSSFFSVCQIVKFLFMVQKLSYKYLFYFKYQLVIFLFELQTEFVK